MPVHITLTSLVFSCLLDGALAPPTGDGPTAATEMEGWGDGGMGGWRDGGMEGWRDGGMGCGWEGKSKEGIGW